MTRRLCFFIIPLFFLVGGGLSQLLFPSHLGVDNYDFDLDGNVYGTSSSSNYVVKVWGSNNSRWEQASVPDGFTFQLINVFVRPNEDKLIVVDGSKLGYCSFTLSTFSSASTATCRSFDTTSFAGQDIWQPVAAISGNLPIGPDPGASVTDLFYLGYASMNIVVEGAMQYVQQARVVRIRGFTTDSPTVEASGILQGNFATTSGAYHTSGSYLIILTNYQVLNISLVSNLPLSDSMQILPLSQSARSTPSQSITAYEIDSVGNLYVVVSNMLLKIPPNSDNPQALKLSNSEIGGSAAPTQALYLPNAETLFLAAPWVSGYVTAVDLITFSIKTYKQIPYFSASYHPVMHPVSKNTFAILGTFQSQQQPSPDIPTIWAASTSNGGVRNSAQISSRNSDQISAPAPAPIINDGFISPRFPPSAFSGAAIFFVLADCKTGYGMTLEGECQKCEIGTAVLPGDPVCSVCPAGTYATQGGLTCALCPFGYLQNNAGATNCTPCENPATCPIGTVFPLISELTDEDFESRVPDLALDAIHKLEGVQKTIAFIAVLLLCIFLFSVLLYALCQKSLSESLKRLDYLLIAREISENENENENENFGAGSSGERLSRGRRIGMGRRRDRRVQSVLGGLATMICVTTTVLAIAFLLKDFTTNNLLLTSTSLYADANDKSVFSPHVEIEFHNFLGLCQQDNVMISQGDLRNPLNASTSRPTVTFNQMYSVCKVSVDMQVNSQETAWGATVLQVFVPGRFSVANAIRWNVTAPYVHGLTTQVIGNLAPEDGFTFKSQLSDVPSVLLSFTETRIKTKTNQKDLNQRDGSGDTEVGHSLTVMRSSSSAGGLPHRWGGGNGQSAPSGSPQVSADQYLSIDQSVFSPTSTSSPNVIYAVAQSSNGATSGTSGSQTTGVGLQIMFSTNPVVTEVSFSTKQTFTLLLVQMIVIVAFLFWLHRSLLRFVLVCIETKRVNVAGRGERPGASSSSRSDVPMQRLNSIGDDQI